MLAFDAGAFGFRNLIINGGFNVNQRAYASGATVGTGLYGHDRWKMAGSADTYTYSTAANVTTVTIPAGKVLQQVVEGTNLQSGTYTLSWTGTAQGKIGAGSYGASGITGTIVGGTNTTIEFGPGTVSNVQLEFGSAATAFEVRHYGLELAMCQRYLPVMNYGGGGDRFLSPATSTTASVITVPFFVQPRVAPTGATVSNPAHFTLYNYANGTSGTPTAITFSVGGLANASLSITTTAGSPTLAAGNPVALYPSSASALILFTGCEL
jgi:hypothetical protein